MELFTNLTVLYIEDNLKCREENAALMRKIGLSVLETDNIEATNEIFRHHKIDIILIDLDLHKKERMMFLHFLRYKEIIAPIIITADDAEKEILLDAINLDTTRYLIKPLRKDELINTIKIAIGKMLPPLPVVLIENELAEGYSYDPINKCINTPNGTSVQLTKKEFLLLELLIKNRKHIVSFDEIERVVWEGSSMSLDALRTLVHSIRHKSYNHVVTSHSGIGYKLDR